MDARNSVDRFLPHQSKVRHYITIRIRSPPDSELTRDTDSNLARHRIDPSLAIVHELGTTDTPVIVGECLH